MLLRDMQDSGYCWGDQGWISDRAQLHEPDTVRVVSDESCAELECESRLPDASGPCQRHQARRTHKALNIGQFPLPPNKAGQMPRKVVPWLFRGQVGGAIGSDGHAPRSCFDEPPGVTLQAHQRRAQTLGIA